MNRRGFFKALGAVVGGIAVEQAIPLGRVWSFPSKIVVRDYYSIQWPVATREWKFGVYVNEVLEAKDLNLDQLNKVTQEHLKRYEVFSDPKTDLSPLMRQWMNMKEWPQPLRPLAPEAEPRSFKYPIVGNIAWHKNRRSA